MTIIITFSGYAQHGKDHTALAVKEEFEKMGKNVLIVHYADYLKYICIQYYGWDGNKDETGREILQKVGTNIVRKRQPNFWVETTLNFIKVFKEDFDVFLIPDCRFRNEVEFIRNDDDLGDEYFAVHIDRVNEDGTMFENTLNPEQRLHPSEIDLDNYEDFDLWLINEGTPLSSNLNAKRIIAHVLEYFVKER